MRKANLEDLESFTTLDGSTITEWGRGAACAAVLLRAGLFGRRHGHDGTLI